MPLTQRIATIRGTLNQGKVPFAAAVSAWFQAHPGIVVQSVDWYRPDSTFKGDEQVLRVAYLEATLLSLGCTWSAVLYQSDNISGDSAQDAFNAAFTAPAPSIIPIFIQDITDHERSRTGPESILVIGISSSVGPLGMVGYDRAAFIADPLALIAAGAAGACALYDASGRLVSASIPVTNLGAGAWIAGERNYAVYDAVTGVLIGIPSCCGSTPWVVPGSTTTTEYPCPAYLPEPRPVPLP